MPQLAESLGVPAAEELAGAIEALTGARVPTSAKVESRYFSTVVRLSVASESGQTALFVKYPKVEASRGWTSMPVRTAGDLELANAERIGLERLATLWPREHGSRWVRLLAYLHGTGGLILEGVEGQDLYRAVRRQDRWSLETIERLGSSLAKFHKTNQLGRWRPDAEKLKRLAGDVGSAVGQELERVVCEIAERPKSKSESGVQSIKGFELRNVLVTDAGQAVLVDPGRLVVDSPAGDLARFVVSAWMCWWGSPRFPVMPGVPQAADTFVAAYSRGFTLPKPELIRFAMAREVLKNWRAAVWQSRGHASGRISHALLLRVYVNPGFRRLLHWAARWS